MSYPTIWQFTKQYSSLAQRPCLNPQRLTPKTGTARARGPQGPRSCMDPQVIILINDLYNRNNTPSPIISSNFNWKVKEIGICLLYFAFSKSNLMIISSSISGIWARIHTIYYRPVTSATTNSNTDAAAGSHSCAQGNINLSSCKGRLISKCPFGIIVWTKIPTKLFLDFCPEFFL